jgi:RND family efflux transporter MFP subunit
MRTKILFILIAFAMTLAGCHQHKEHEHDSDDHTNHDHSEDFIYFTQDQADAARVAVEVLSPDTFRQVIKTSGQILSGRGDEATVSATATGIVSFSKSSIASGSAVKAGESVVTISSNSLPDGDPIAKAKISYETALKEYERASNLVKDQIISVKEYEQIRLMYETAKMNYEAQASNYSANGVRVTSSLGGFIKNLYVNQGDFVTVGQPIATISQNKKLQLRAEVSETYFSSISTINDANFKMAYDNKLYKLSELNGKLISHGKASDGESFYIPITFEFDNIGNIIAGSFAEIFLLSTPQIDVISAPVSAITEEQGLYFVYIKTDDEHYRKQEVTLGETDGARVHIKSGLNAGDIVVTNGVYQVKLAATPSVIPEGHTH